MFFRRAAIALTAVLAMLKFAPSASADTVSVYWDSVALYYIQQTGSLPQTTAMRLLTVMHAAMYDAWTAYDPVAVPSRPNGILKRPPEEITDANKIEAISFAARKALVDLLPSMAASIDAALTRLGYDLEDAGSADTATPAGIGNVAAEAVARGTYSTDYSVVTRLDSNDDSNEWRLDWKRVVQRDSRDSTEQHGSSTRQNRVDHQ
jgi:hypothetical protein